jgi:hypothetical protein
MSDEIEKTKLEKKLQRAKQGYAGLPEGMPPFAFPERSLIREEVIERFQKGLDLFTEVRTTREAFELALEKQKRAAPALEQFHREDMQVARHHFGADAKVMATFGVEKPSRSTPRVPRVKPKAQRCEPEVIEEVVTTVIEEVILEGDEQGCEPRAPRRGCEAPRPRGSRVKQRVR